MTWVLSALGALATIALLVLIHEFGHFIVARALGVGVEVFSIGFGSPLVERQWGGTKYRIAAFPFGGYVRMLGGDPFSESGADGGQTAAIHEAAAAVRGRRSPYFMSRPPFERLLIMLAGPAANLILPFVLFAGVMVIGEPQARSDVGTVMVDSPAARAGFREADRIVAIDETAVSTWNDVYDALTSTTGSTVHFVVVRGGEEVALQVPITGPGGAGSREIDALGFDGYAPDTTLVVDSPDAPVALAGLTTGDKVTAVDNVAVRDFNALTAALEGRTGPTTFTVARTARDGDASTQTLVVTPRPGWAAAPTAADDALWQTWGLASATTSVGMLTDASAAGKAGVKPGDRLLIADNRTIHRFADLLDIVKQTAAGAGAGQTAHALDLQVRRNGELLSFHIQPDVIRDVDMSRLYRWRPMIGVGAAGQHVAPPAIPRPYPLPQALLRASDETTTVAAAIVKRVGEMITLEAPPQDNLGGPVAMVMQAKAAADLGVLALVRQMGFFSISLGVLNLLPIPALDGGQIMMYTAEWLRGRPLPMVLRERAQQAGVLFLVLLTFAVFLNDIYRAGMQLLGDG